MEQCDQHTVGKNIKIIKFGIPGLMQKLANAGWDSEKGKLKHKNFSGIYFPKYCLADSKCEDCPQEVKITIEGEVAKFIVRGWANSGNL